MKIRKTILQDEEIAVYVYENKKAEYFVTSIPRLEWSLMFTYEEGKAPLLERLSTSLHRVVDTGEAEMLARRVYEWTREM